MTKSKLQNNTPPPYEVKGAKQQLFAMVFTYASPAPGSSIELPKGGNTDRTPNDWCSPPLVHHVLAIQDTAQTISWQVSDLQ